MSTDNNEYVEITANMLGQTLGEAREKQKEADLKAAKEEAAAKAIAEEEAAAKAIAEEEAAAKAIAEEEAAAKKKAEEDEAAKREALLAKAKKKAEEKAKKKAKINANRGSTTTKEKTTINENPLVIQKEWPVEWEEINAKRGSTRNEARRANWLKRAQQVENLLSKLYKVKPGNATKEQIEAAEIAASLVEEKVPLIQTAKNIPSPPAKSSSSITDRLKNIVVSNLPKSLKIPKPSFNLLKSLRTQTKQTENKINNLQNTAKTKQEQLQKQLTQIETEKQRLQQQLKEAKDSKQNEEITQRKIERLEEVEKSNEKSIKNLRKEQEELEQKKEELEKQKEELEVYVTIFREKKRKAEENFRKEKGGLIESAIGILDEKDSMDNIKIEDIEKGYPTLHKKIKNFLVFKEDELIKAHHAKFYSDNIKRNNNKLVETLKLVPSEPFLGIGLAFGSTKEQEEKTTEKEIESLKPTEKEKEIKSLKEIKKDVRDFIKGRADYIFDLSQHHKLSVKEYLKTL